MLTNGQEKRMNKILDAGINYLNAVYWAIECEEYANRYVKGKKWVLNAGDKEALRIEQFAKAKEKRAFREMEEALNNN